jgi:1-pyrroline-5-carboxylate dehydrogenase
MPRTDTDLIHGGGQVVNQLLLRAQPRSTLFTGSQRVAEKLAVDMKGKVRGY